MKRVITYIWVFVFFAGCVEPFEASTEVFEDVLAIDALLTDELRLQKVLLTRAFRFEQDVPTAERNATVKIMEDATTEFGFEETTPGVYMSETPFAAKSGSSYELQIETSDGRSYRSSSVTTPHSVPINLKTERGRNDIGNEGVRILLDNSSTTANTTYFRYEYEETYKIIAPDWDPFEFDIIDDIACADGDAYEVGVKPRVGEQRVCFGSAVSTDVMQTTTDGLGQNEVSNFQLRFLNRDNYIISHRYSILVRQYSQTQEAHSFYKNLNDFSSSESIFSEVQPGFLFGNISSETDADEKVLGYFEVAAVNSERLYFNYEDLFPGEDLPTYAVNCANPGNPQLTTAGYHCDLTRMVCDGACDSPLIEGIKAGILVYIAENENITEELRGPFFTKPSACGDCTKLGSNIVPDFWEE